jgi:hypothetical protein
MSKSVGRCADTRLFATVTWAGSEGTFLLDIAYYNWTRDGVHVACEVYSAE